MKLWIVFIVLWLGLIPLQARSQEQGKQGNWQNNTIIALSTPETVVAKRTTIAQAQRYPKKAKTVPYHKIGSNCVATVRQAGYYVPRTKDGYARTMPVSSTELPPENVPVVIKTAESKAGHVLVAVRKGDQLISIIEGNHPQAGQQRVVPLSLYRGYVSTTLIP